MKKWCRRILTGILILGILGGLAALGASLYVVKTTEERIVGPEAVPGENWDCVLVLGAGVRPDGSPSDMLYDRVRTGLDLYHGGAAPKLLMSGDHGRSEYDEVGCMLGLALEDGVAAADVFLDHAGFSTYESMYRAKEIFGVQNMIVVTQRYHMYRALYIAEKMGIESYGVAADQNLYGGQTMRDIRELLAQCKDFFKTMLMPEPTYLGEAIPISGSGDATNDKQKTEEP